MGFVIAFALWILGDILMACGRDSQRAERNAERRHRELMEAQKNKQPQKKVVTRRVIRDAQGRFIAAEEIEQWEE